MNEADAQAAAARACPCRKGFMCGKDGKDFCRNCKIAPAVAEAILAAWKQGAEEMRERAEVVLVEERLKHVVANPAFGNGLAFGATMVRALKVTE